MHLVTDGKPKGIYVPTKMSDYYIKRLGEELHSLIVELVPKKRQRRNKVQKNLIEPTVDSLQKQEVGKRLSNPVV